MSPLASVSKTAATKCWNSYNGSPKEPPFTQIAFWASTLSWHSALCGLCHRSGMTGIALAFPRFYSWEGIVKMVILFKCCKFIWKVLCLWMSSLGHCTPVTCWHTFGLPDPIPSHFHSFLCDWFLCPPATWWTLGLTDDAVHPLMLRFS